MKLYNHVTFKISRLVTQAYSTSFAMATMMFEKEVREAIYNIYGFVRFSDEIVDSFHFFDKEYLLKRFEADTFEAIKSGISTNPVLNSFQITVKKYKIPEDFIRAFLYSMCLDLNKKHYSNISEMQEYIYGSAEVVGLMCLKVFCADDESLYKQLELPARKLGSAFQKVNFLRDLNNDSNNLGRKYFPILVSKDLDESAKKSLIEDIENDFMMAYQGIKRLPGRSKLAVLIAYYYYQGLLRKIQFTPATMILNSRIRISNARKIALLFKASVVYKFKLI
jgi:15-cis-phytoene synthase